MPRANKGPRLELYGPDTRFGAKAKRGFTEYRFYIVWSDAGRKCERSTGTSDIGFAEGCFRAFLEERANAAKVVNQTAGSLRADQMSVADVLDIYGREHAPQTAAPARIGFAIDALLPYWAALKVSDIKGETVRRYMRFRRDHFAAREAKRVTEQTARGRLPPPARTLSDDTVRRELVMLSAALKHCHREGYLIDPPAVWLPEKGVPRDRHLSRSDIARLLWTARKSARGRTHLTLYILIAFYTGARRSAILELQWQPNTVGGWVDLERGVIDFQGSARRTKKRRSTIPIPDRLMTFLKLARRRTVQYVIEFEGSPIRDPKKALATAGRAAGLGNVFSHLLKHSAITYLLGAGVPLWEVAGWTGTSEETIRRVYGHHSPDYLSSAVKALR
ncbi:site-specific integrase [Skermanella rosea]|uniref:tyrosine-type recombinase/integrase n=1 Tax=Skermanella rosea TaxID=1817965 RepID=UPI0019328777|nr:site-specific integrase [Skermanella rosea]UEM03458.1 site-specific integrase [Skermanella rosea]